MNKKVGIPIIIAAVIGLVIFLIVMGKTFVSGPESVKTAPPPWIDPATGKPKGQMTGSSAQGPGAVETHSGAPGGSSGR